MATFTGTVNASAGDAAIADLGYDGTGTTMQVGGVNSAAAANTGQGWLFPNVTLTSADTINSVILKLMKSSTQFSTQSNRWTAINQDNTAVFSSGSAPGSRPIVATIIVDSNNVNETNGTVYNFPRSSGNQISFAAAISAVLARGGWASGNAIGIVNNSKQDGSQVTTSARKVFHTWDSATASSEPQLVIDYTAGSAPINASVQFDGVSTLSGGSPVLASSATFVAAAVLSAGSPVFLSSASITAAGALAVTPVFASSAAFAGTSIFTGGSPQFRSSAVFAGTGTLTVSAIYSGPASAAFAGTSSLLADSPVFLSSALFDGTSTLTVTPVFESWVHIDGTSTVTGGSPKFLASVSFAGAATVFASSSQSSPIISNVTVTSITATSAVIEWDTDIPADSRVEYGTVPTYGSTTPTTDQYPANVLHHSVTLTGLPENTEIYYRLWSLSPALDNNSASFAGSATLSAGTPKFLASAALAGVGALSATPVLIDTNAASFAGTGTLTVTPVLIYSAAFASAGVGTLSTGYSYSGPASAVMAGTSTLSATPSLLTPTAATFAATGSLAATPTLATPASVSMAGEAVASFGAVLINAASASFTGIGTFSVAAIQYLPVSATSTGFSALIIGTVFNTQPISIAFAGTSVLSVVPSGINQGSASFSGSSTLSAVYEYRTIIGASVTFAAASAFTILSYGYTAARPAFAATRIQQVVFAATYTSAPQFTQTYTQSTAFAVTSSQEVTAPAARASLTAYAVGSDRKG